MTSNTEKEVSATLDSTEVLSVNNQKFATEQDIHVLNNNQPLVLSEGSITYLFFKRGMDILLSFIGMIILSPLFIIVSIWIKLEDKNGPVFFKQQRVGKNGEIFYMYKFRSMVSNAEDLLHELLHLNEVSGAMFKIKFDPRITKVGRFIRATSIDELPQLWNVFKGEMSLVGPRPPLIKEVEQYNEKHMKRLSVKPGCTGLWQATVRNSVGFEEMVDLDIKYIIEKNVWYDIKIIFMTILIIFKSNAH